MLTPEEQLSMAINKGRITGSWLICGPFGVGKKRLATRFSSFLMTGDWNKELSFHSNIKWIRCGLTDEAKKEIQKMILAGKLVEENDKTRSRKKEITVDEIRQGLQFLSLKPGFSEYKILIIDLADDMNENAANALLKVLEEPPEQSIIFLLCQNTGKILPTIRSRCRQIILKPLSYEKLVQWIRDNLPECQDPELLADLAEGSIGMAQRIYDQNGILLYQKIKSFIKPLIKIDIEGLSVFLDSLLKEEGQYQLCCFFLLKHLSEKAKEEALNNSFTALSYLDLYETVQSEINTIDSLNLDRKQVLMNIFFKISEGVRND